MVAVATRHDRDHDARRCRLHAHGRRGDNPTRVANKYGITVDELAAANAGNPAYQNFLIGSSLVDPRQRQLLTP